MCDLLTDWLSDESLLKRTFNLCFYIVGFWSSTVDCHGWVRLNIACKSSTEYMSEALERQMNDHLK